MTTLALAVTMALLHQSAGVPEARWQRMFSGVNMPHGFMVIENQTLDKQRAFTSSDEVKIMKGMGIKNVRIPFVPEAIAKSYSPPILDPAKLANLRRAIEFFRREGILVQLDLHDGTRLTRGMESSLEPVRELKAFWRVVADELKDVDPNYLMFEILNEPQVQDGALWWSIQKSVISEIRSVAPTHTIIVQASKWSSVDDLRARAPYTDKNIIYAFHFYEPFIFTHQGANWTTFEQGDWRHVRYPTTTENLESLKSQITSANKRRLYDSFAAQPWNAARIRERIRLIADWAERYDARVTCNEFGTVRETVNSRSRFNWHKDTVRAFEELGVGWSVYEWRGGMGMHYGKITNVGAKDTVDWNIIDALGWRRPKLR